MKTKAERKEEAYAKYEYEKERARYKAWIKLQDWTNKHTSRDLVILHIKEAIELKSIIDNLVFDFLVNIQENKEELK